MKKKIEQEVNEAIDILTEGLLDCDRTELVEVIWEDARTLSGSSNYQEIQKEGLVSARTVGYLVYEDKERVAICGFLFPDMKTSLQDPEQITSFRDVHMIPRKLIKVVKVLTIDWERTRKFRDESKRWLDKEELGK